MIDIKMPATVLT